MCSQISKRATVKFEASVWHAPIISALCSAVDLAFIKFLNTMEFRGIAAKHEKSLNINLRDI